ncbi:putative HTH-type transcriptional regulator YdfH [Symmachiella dynata]|nr:putative HTH-type transcriptional regulator YdfH [Symmachiella dynata]
MFCLHFKRFKCPALLPHWFGLSTAATRRLSESTNMTSDNPSGRAPSLKNVAYGQLKQLILEGGVEPGTVLSVRQLADQLKMSKTPVQAALERMEAEDLVTFAPQQGVLVRHVSIEDIANHFEIRTALESFIVERLAGGLTDEQTLRLKANLTAQHELAQSGDVLGCVKNDTDFHLLLCEFHGNQEFAKVMHRLRDRVFQVVFRIVKQFPNRITETYEEHHEIATAIFDGNGELAAQQLVVHLQNGLKQFIPA